MTLTPNDSGRRQCIAAFLILATAIGLTSAASLASGQWSHSRLLGKRFLLYDSFADVNVSSTEQLPNDETNTTTEEPTINEMNSTVIPDVPVTVSRCGEHFDCGDFCIPKALECDTEGDCTHNEDERNCPENCQGVNMFKCQDGLCISLSRRCDAVPDCWDDSDEVDCHNFPCDTTIHFRCTTSGACIDKAYRCDYTPDCGDNSDESNCP